jgi:hypothetical protein
VVEVDAAGSAAAAGHPAAPVAGLDEAFLRRGGPVAGCVGRCDESRSVGAGGGLALGSADEARTVPAASAGAAGAALQFGAGGDGDGLAGGRVVDGDEN